MRSTSLDSSLNIRKVKRIPTVGTRVCVDLCTCKKEADEQVVHVFGSKFCACSNHFFIHVCMRRSFFFILKEFKRC